MRHLGFRAMSSGLRVEDLRFRGLGLGDQKVGFEIGKGVEGLRLEIRDIRN